MVGLKGTLVGDGGRLGKERRFGVEVKGDEAIEVGEGEGRAEVEVEGEGEA